MLIKRIIPLNSYKQNTNTLSRKIILKRIKRVKRENIKSSPEQVSENLKNMEIKRTYKPLNPDNRFNSSSIGLSEMMKRNNISLISDDSIRNVILKFRQERAIEHKKKRIYYLDKKYEDFKKEKNNNFLLLRAMLRKDPITIQSLIKRNRNKEKKPNKLISMKGVIRNRTIYGGKGTYIGNRSSDSFGKNTFYKKTNNSNNSTIYLNSNKSVTIEKNKNKYSKKKIWKKDFLIKFENTRKAYLKKKELKITGAFGLTVQGHSSLFFTAQNPRKKFNQDCNFFYANFLSTKLGEISLFGIFDGNGPYGKGIALGLKNYIIDYFKRGHDMKVNLKKDNFYSIMYNAFIRAQEYLINNSKQLNINMKYSGATGIIVLYLHNETNRVFCANLGRNKCMFYTNMGSIRLSFELFPYRASERFRIALFKQQRMNQTLEKDKKNNKDKNKNINDNNKNNENNTININNTNNINDNNINDNNKNNNANIDNKNNINENNNNNINETNINKEPNQNELKMSNNAENENENNEKEAELKLLIEKEKEDFLKDFKDLDISRCIGNLAAEELGIIPGPEIVESDVKGNKGRSIVIGTESFWKYLNEDEVGVIVNKHYPSSNSEDACKDLQELAKERWKEKTGGYDDISVIVIFFDSKNLN